MAIDDQIPIRSVHRLLRVGGEAVEVLRASFDARPFSRHYHETPTIGLVRSGANRFHYGRHFATAERGELCLVDPGEVHDGGHAGATWAYDCVFPSATLMRRLSRLSDIEDYPWFASPSMAGALAPDLDLFFRQLFGPAPEPELCEELLVSGLLSLIAHARARAKPHLCDSPVARLAVEFIEDNVRKPVLLGDIAEAVGANRFTIIRAVAKQTGLTPRQLILQRRVDRAREALLAGSSIAETAYAWGFADQAHLSREFKRRWGVSPGVFARSARTPVLRALIGLGSDTAPIRQGG